MVSVYSDPDENLLKESSDTLRVVRYQGTKALHVIDAKWISSVMALIPFILSDQEKKYPSICTHYTQCFFIGEKAFLDFMTMTTDPSHERDEDLEMEPPNGEQQEAEDEIPEGASEADAMEDIDHRDTVEDEQLGDEGQAGDEMTEQCGQEADGDGSTGKEEAIAQADISAGQGGAESAQSTMDANQEQQLPRALESSVPGEHREQAADILEDRKERYAHLMIGNIQQLMNYQDVSRA